MKRYIKASQDFLIEQAYELYDIAYEYCSHTYLEDILKKYNIDTEHDELTSLSEKQLTGLINELNNLLHRVVPERGF